MWLIGLILLFYALDEGSLFLFICALLMMCG